MVADSTTNFNSYMVSFGCLGVTLRLLGPFGAFWGKVWALGAKVWDPTMRAQEPYGRAWGLGITAPGAGS